MTTSPSRAPPAWRVIVADDDEDTRLLMAAALRRGGFAVTEVTNGRDLLTAVFREPPTWTLIVSDIGMPGIDGVAVTRALRRGRVRAPILLVTAFGDEKTVREALAAGADRILSKPFELSLLRKVAFALVFDSMRRDPSDRGAATEHEGERGQDQEDDEEDLRDSSRAGRDPAEAEKRSHERDYQENCGPIQHDGTPLVCVEGTRRS
jgi:CheY-like chemotaxis protein